MCLWLPWFPGKWTGQICLYFPGSVHIYKSGKYRHIWLVHFPGNQGKPQAHWNNCVKLISSHVPTPAVNKVSVFFFFLKHAGNKENGIIYKFPSFSRFCLKSWKRHQPYWQLAWAQAKKLIWHNYSNVHVVALVSRKMDLSNMPVLSWHSSYRQVETILPSI